MLTETARVVAAERGAVWVETVRQSVCGKCSAARGCGHGLLNRSGARSSYLRLSTSHLNLEKGDADGDGGRGEERAFRVGDEVAIAIPESLMLKGSLLLYAMPLLTMLALAAIAALLFPESAEAASALGAFIGLGLGLGLVRVHAGMYSHDDSLRPQLLGLARAARGAKAPNETQTPAPLNAPS